MNEPKPLSEVAREAAELINQLDRCLDCNITDTWRELRLAKYFIQKQQELLTTASLERQELLRDKARLDLIESDKGKRSLRYHKKRWTYLGFTNYEYDTYETIREALDTAQSASEASQEAQRVREEGTR